MIFIKNHMIFDETSYLDIWMIHLYSRFWMKHPYSRYFDENPYLDFDENNPYLDLDEKSYSRFLMKHHTLNFDDNPYPRFG